MSTFSCCHNIITEQQMTIMEDTIIEPTYFLIISIIILQMSISNRHTSILCDTEKRALSFAFSHCIVRTWSYSRLQPQNMKVKVKRINIHAILRHSISGDNEEYWLFWYLGWTLYRLFAHVFDKAISCIQVLQQTRC